MKIKIPGSALICLMLTACSSGSMHAMKIEDTLNSYASAIRWGAFEKATDFQNPARRTHLDLAWLKNIHVSTYDPVYRKGAPDDNVQEQTVEIRYFNEQEGVEKSIIDRQVWRYDEDSGRLMLETDLPRFR